MANNMQAVGSRSEHTEPEAMEEVTVNVHQPIRPQMERGEGSKLKRARAHTDQDVGSNDFEDEDLFGPMSDDEWDKLEKQLKTTVTVVVFSMTEASVEVDDTNDVHFEGETLGVINGTRKNGESTKKTTTYLSGQPTKFDSALWCLLKPGYMDVEGVRV
ncbi:hypothetical protein PHMEG_00031974 [Phytophthora megakarya]|uniref:Uncharacterized protein n=1 Tax=Phytophthora megakarya TaxID=4795 RepID=A0A225UX12_9STRA|nr:hypothetical protein PHMEG_00031974 [Phytophthora megakarya]